MRILIATAHWGVIGGSERYAAELAPRLAARGHRISVLAGSASAGPPAGIRLELLPAWSEARPGSAGASAIARLVRAEAPEAVLVLSSRSERALAALERTLEHRGLPPPPLVRFVQDHVPFCPGLNKLREGGARCRQAMGAVCLEQYVLGAGCVGYKRAHHPGDALAPVSALAKHLAAFERLRRAQRVLVASEHVRRELLDLGLAPTRVVRLPYFAPRVHAPAALDPALETFARGAPLLFAPARLVLPDKGIDFLLTALGQLDRPFRCVVAGSGPAEAALRAKARAEGLADRVRFAGWLGAGELAALFERARAVVVPSVWDEPFGIVGLEAMSHGRPVAAFDVGGIREWLADGETGALCAPRDTVALAHILDRWLADPECADRLGRAGRARLERDFAAEPHLAAVERALGR